MIHHMMDPRNTIVSWEESLCRICYVPISDALLHCSCSGSLRMHGKCIQKWVFLRNSIVPLHLRNHSFSSWRLTCEICLTEFKNNELTPTLRDVARMRRRVDSIISKFETQKEMEEFLERIFKEWMNGSCKSFNEHEWNQHSLQIALLIFVAFVWIPPIVLCCSFLQSHEIVSTLFLFLYHCSIFELGCIVSAILLVLSVFIAALLRLLDSMLETRFV